MNEKIKQVLDSILERFKNGDIPQAVAYSMFPIAEDIPSTKWSLLNRTLMFLAGTADARGYKQWLAKKRYVKKGSKPTPYSYDCFSPKTGYNQKCKIPGNSTFYVALRGVQGGTYKLKLLMKD